MAIISSGINEWYRVCVELTDPSLVSVDKGKLDKYIQNALQICNIVIHIAVNGELKYTLYPPSNVAGQIWDLGFINGLNGELMTINSLAQTSPNSRLEYCNEYFAFYAFVCQKPNIKSTFGFDKSGIHKFEDTVIDAQMFAQFIEKSLSLPPGGTSNGFLNRLVNGTSDLFGNVSLKLLTRLINLHMVATCEMEYSKTIGSIGTVGQVPTTGAKRRLEFGFLKSSPSARDKQQFSSPGKSGIGIAHIFSITQ